MVKAPVSWAFMLSKGDTAFLREIKHMPILAGAGVTNKCVLNA